MHSFTWPRLMSIVLCSVLGLSCTAGAESPKYARADASADAAEPAVAVVELFTSEGCSSCPPADALLAELADAAQGDGTAVYALSFHVDYWNRLGWKDPYSSSMATARQRTYAEKFQSGSYTPQMVVNGSQQFVGSDRRKADAAISKALNRNVSASVAVQATAESDSVRVRYKLVGVPAGSVLNVAWAQRQAESHPTHGENGGRTLRHTNVVRSFRSLKPDASLAGEVTLSRAGVSDGVLVAYVQTPDGQVHGASAVDVK